MDTLILGLESLAAKFVDDGAVWISGIAWSIVFLVKASRTDKHLVPPDLWSRLAQNGGNLFVALQSDMCLFARFFSTYPGAAACMPFWQKHPNLHLIVITSTIACALSEAGDLIPCKCLADTLKLFSDLPTLTQALFQLAKCVHSHPDRAARFKEIATKLLKATTENAVSIILSTARKWDHSCSASPASSAASAASVMPATSFTAAHLPMQSEKKVSTVSIEGELDSRIHSKA